MTDKLFLTKEQLKQLTGTADRKKQAICLRSNRIPFTLDIFGRPVVTVSSIERKPAVPEETTTGWAGPSFLQRAA